VELDAAVYAFDASTIDLCLSVFAWAPFRSTKAAIKLHTLLDLRGNIPSFIHITDGKTHEVNVMDELVLEPGAFYLMDRGYLDFASCLSFTKLTLLRDSRQEQHKIQTTLLAASGSNQHHGAVRSDRSADDVLFEQGLSHHTAPRGGQGRDGQAHGF
jgi:hypothetical protein